MTVGLVHRFFWRRGAVPAVVREWADHLEAAGHRVVVFSSDVEAAASTGRRTYVPVAMRRGKLFDRAGFAFAARVYRALRRGAPLDAVLCVDSTAYFGVWLAGRRLRMPTIMALQGWIYAPGKRGVYLRTVTWMYKLAVHFCVRVAPMIGCLSQEMYDGLRGLGASPERLWRAPNCVDLDRWRTGKDGAHGRDERQVLFIGRLDPVKGLEFLIEALPAVVERLGGVRLLVLGGVEPDDGRYHELAQACGVADRVEFGGVVDRGELPAIYADADVMVLPSLSEGHALAPLECLACGTPVIGSDIPGVQETVQDGVNGLLVPPRDPGALAEALCRVLGDGALLDRLSRAARSSVARFAWPPRVREFEALCRRLSRAEGWTGRSAVGCRVPGSRGSLADGGSRGGRG